MTDAAVLIARLTLGGMWIIAAVAKLASSEPRSRAVEEFGWLRGRPAQVIGLALPYIELTLGLLLMTGVEIDAAALVSVFLLAVFSGAMAVSLLQGHRVRCNCFGQVGEGYVSWASTVRNLLLLALALVPLALHSDYLALDRLIVGDLQRAYEPPVISLVEILSNVVDRPSGAPSSRLGGDQLWRGRHFPP